MIAGPNGSGKSTLTSLLQKAGIEFGEYLNADDIAKTMTGDPVEVAAKAQQVVRDARDAALLEGRSHAFETVMSHISHIDYLRHAKLRGFSVQLFYVCTDNPAINLARVENRVLHGGHPVPSDRVIGRYARSLANLPAAVAVADYGQLFDNSFADRPMQLLATISAGQVSLDRARMDFKCLHITPDWWIGVLSSLPAADGSSS